MSPLNDVTVAPAIRSRATGSAPNPAFSASYSGFVLGEGPSVLTGTLSCTTTALTTLVILKRWAMNPAFLKADITICLIAENQTELNPGIVQNPGVAPIAIPLPDEDERLADEERAGE
jgi:hypothetical protein